MNPTHHPADPRMSPLGAVAQRRHDALTAQLGPYGENGVKHAHIFEAAEEIADAYNYMVVFLQKDRPRNAVRRVEQVLRMRVELRLLEAWEHLERLARLYEAESDETREILNPTPLACEYSGAKFMDHTCVDCGETVGGQVITYTGQALPRDPPTGGCWWFKDMRGDVWHWHDGDERQWYHTRLQVIELPATEKRSHG